MIGWAYSISNLVIAPAAFLIAVCFFYLAIKYGGKKLAVAFTSFGSLFLAGGVERLQHLSGQNIPWWKALTTSVVAFLCLICAYAMVKCVGSAMPMLARLAVKVRQFSESRSQVLQGRPEASEKEAAQTLTEVRDMMRSVMEKVRT